MEDLITYASILFDAHHSPPLPPIPAGEPIPSYVYGTSHTKIASVPPSPRLPRTNPPEDFTPRLPPRPANSIHPSSRANVAPPKDRGDIQYMLHIHDEVPPSPSTTTMIDTGDEIEAPAYYESEPSLETPTFQMPPRPSSLAMRKLQLEALAIESEHRASYPSPPSPS
jgi:hypothetical protein